MGLKDTAAKNFFGMKEVMADILGYVLNQEGLVVQSDSLRLVSGESYRILQGPDGKLKSDNRYRDILFEYDTGEEQISVGLELQSRRDWGMLPRIMGYDSRRYGNLLREGRLHRIINIVLHFDRDSPRPASELEQLMPRQKLDLGGCFYNYGFVSLNIYDMAENLERFRCKELRRVLYYFRLERDGDRLMKALAADRLSRDAAILCAVFLGLDIKIDDESEEIDMCKGVRDFKRKYIRMGEALGRKKGMDEGINIGRNEGINIGRNEGRRSATIDVVKNLLNMSFSVFDITKITGASEQMVQEIALSLQA